MPSKHLAALTCAAVIFLLCRQAGATTCLTGECHRVLTSTAYLHGPVAAEQLGADGCTACHVPAGRSCTPAGGGAFKPMPPADRMCQLCHSRGTGTQHSVQKIDCLRCHDPHGSNASPELRR